MWGGPPLQSALPARGSPCSLARCGARCQHPGSSCAHGRQTVRGQDGPMHPGGRLLGRGPSAGPARTARAGSARRLCVNGGGRGIRFLAGRGGSGRTGGRSRQPSAAARSACAKACGGSGGGGTAQRHGTASMFKESHVHLDVVVSRHRSTRATRAARAARVFCRSRKHGPRVGLCRVLGLREWRARVHDDCCHMLVTGERASAAVPKSSRARAAARVHARASWSTDVLEPASCRGHGPVGRRAAPIAASS